MPKLRAVRLLVLAAFALVGAAAPGAAKEICIEELAGVCLKYKTVPDEPRVTSSPAQRAEQRLSLGRDERRGVQGGLIAAGHYSGAIDGAFGPQTRRGIKAWQRADGRLATGYLDRNDADDLIALGRVQPPANTGTASGGLYFAFCGDSGRTGEYDVGWSDRSLAEAYGQAIGARGTCEQDGTAGHGECMVFAESTNGAWAWRRRVDEGDARRLSMKTCTEFDNGACSVTGSFCTRSEPEPVETGETRREPYRYGFVCGTGGRKFEYVVRFSNGSAKAAEDAARAAFPGCPKTISMTPGSCTAFVHGGVLPGDFWQWTRRTTETDARTAAVKACNEQGRGACQVGEVICLR